MPLFRFHHGSLKESLRTTIVVKTFNDVVKAIVFKDEFSDTIKMNNWGAAFQIRAYPDKENNFDERIGWYTYVVKANLYEEKTMSVVGFLSEPLIDFIDDEKIEDQKK